MINLINFFIEANILLLVFGLVYYALIRTQSNFQFRRVYIVLATISAGTIPFISFNTFLPESGLQFLPSAIPIFTLPELVIGGGASSESLNPAHQSINWPLYLFGTYAVVSGLLLLRFAVQLCRLYLLIRSSHTHRTRKENYVLLENDQLTATFSFFNFMFLGRIQSLSDIEKAQVIHHEEVHIRQWHSFDLVLLEIVRSVFWANPVVWFFRNEQDQNHEFLADQSASSHYDKDAYQQLLVKMALGQFQPVGNYFAKTQTLKRIDMMNQKKEKTRLLSLVGACVVSASVLVFMACNEDVVQSPETSTSLESKIIEVPAQQSFVGQELADEVFDIVENLPAPVGGMETFYKHIANQIKYPTLARQNGIEGRVFVQFIVDKEGKLTNAKVVKGIGGGCDEEAVRILANAPAWNPGLQRGKPVNVRMILPVTFKIMKEGESTENIDSDDLSKIKGTQTEELVVVGYQSK